MGRNNRRASVAAAGERHATDLVAKMGAALRDARRRVALTQAQAAARAGVSQATWSDLEVARDPRHTLATWDRAAFAVGGRLHAYLEGSSAATLPRDMVQLGAQELIIRTSSVGGWGGLGEEAIDRNIGRSRFADVLLDRRRRPAQPEYALFEVIDWFEDVGDPMRAWQRRLDAVERYAIARMQPGDDLPAVSGCWVVRATQRNRRLVADHRHLFSSRFPGPGHAWLAALGDPARPCRPPQPCYGSLSTARG